MLINVINIMSILFFYLLIKIKNYSLTLIRKHNFFFSDINLNHLYYIFINNY